MSGSDHPSSPSGNKRHACPETAAAEALVQQLWLNTSAEAANPPAVVPPPPSAAQRCAADALTLVFEFIEFEELVYATRSCPTWRSAAAKERPRRLTFDRADRLAALCASSSPLKRHISRVACNRYSSSLSVNQLAQLSRLPELTSLEVRPDAAALSRLMRMPAEGGGALAELKAAFPPRLRELTLFVSKVHSAAACQLLLDALPAVKELDRLTLTPLDVNPGQTATLSLEPLLQLPRLTHLTWIIGDLTVPQLEMIKQIATLQSIDPGLRSWSAAQLSALCRPSHRLQQLQEVNLWQTAVDATAMTHLACLPGLTRLTPFVLLPDAYAHLPRFPQLQRLLVPLKHVASAQQVAHNNPLVSALSGCSALIDLTLNRGECSESFCGQLMQAVPRLRALSFNFCSPPSLSFLRHSPHLVDLRFEHCEDLRLSHVVAIGAFAPQLESLTFEFCDGLQLDGAEVQLLTPPGSLGLPHLREFDYLLALEESDSDDE
jgi:hypothetical protein